MSYSLYKQASVIINQFLEKKGEATEPVVPETATEQPIPTTPQEQPTQQQKTNGWWDATKKGIGYGANGVMTALPFAFASNFPSWGEAGKVVDDSVRDNRMLWNATRKWPASRWIPRAAGRSLTGLGLPGLGLWATWNSVPARVNEISEDSNNLGKVIGGAQTAFDVGLGLSDLAYLTSQFAPKLATNPWVRIPASAGFRYAGPGIAASVLWDLGNAYRKAQRKEIREAVGRNEARQEASNGLARVGSDLGSMEEVKVDLPDLEGGAYENALKILATKAVMPTTIRASNKVNPGIFGTNFHNVKHTGPVQMDWSMQPTLDETTGKEYIPMPKVTNPGYMEDDAINGTEGTPDQMYALPSGANRLLPIINTLRPDQLYKAPYATMRAMSEVKNPPKADPDSTLIEGGVQRATRSQNAAPTTFIGPDGKEHSFTPEYYDALYQQTKNFSPKDYLPWWLRPFVPIKD